MSLTFITGNGLAGVFDNPFDAFIGSITGGASGSVGNVASGAVAGGGGAVTVALKTVQAALNRFNPTRLARLVVDGKSGSKTTARIREFQSNMGLPQTGIVDYSLITALGVTGSNSALGGSINKNPAQGVIGSATGSVGDSVTNAVNAAVAIALGRASTSALPSQNVVPSGSGGQAVLRGMMVDVSLFLGIGAHDNAKMQALRDRLSSNGFTVISSDDPFINVSRVVKVRVRVESDGYANVRDAASVVAGIAGSVGFNVTGFEGAVASGVFNGGSGSGFSLGNLFGDSKTTQLLAVAGVAVAGIVVVKMVNDR